jgi:plastocyanin
MLLLTLFLALIISSVPPALAQTEQGTVTVRVLYHGTIPPPTDVNVTRDPEICGTQVLLQSLTVHSPSGGLKDAVVTIDGIPAPETAPIGMVSKVLSNSRCSFSPHVMSLQTGSPLEIHNQDPIMHNTHISNEMRTFINVAMVVNGRPVAKTVSKPGLYRVQCDVHKFMGGYVLASTHPYFGVTDDHGNTRILNVPAGHHDISVWHELLGQLQAHVSVPPNGETIATFEFREGGTGHGRHMNR